MVNTNHKISHTCLQHERYDYMLYNWVDDNLARADIGDIEKQLRMAEWPGESRFAIQCSPRRSPFASPFAIRLVILCAVRHSPRRFLFIFPQFSLFKLRCSMFAAPLAISSSPFANRRAIRRAIRCRFSMSPDAFHTYYTGLMFILYNQV